MPSVGLRASRSVASPQTSAKASLRTAVRPLRSSHVSHQGAFSHRASSSSVSSVRVLQRSCISCTAQRDTQQQPVELVTPEIVPEDEQCDLQAQSAPVQPKTRGPASWLLAGYQKKVTALLGFAGLSAASLIGKQCLCLVQSDQVMLLVTSKYECCRTALGDTVHFKFFTHHTMRRTECCRQL